jgi:hypothetical protein
MNWFECKVSYEKMMENGVQKRVSELYLVDALSFTEAEARIIEKVKAYVSGEFQVANIKRSVISELFFNAGGDRYYRFKLYFITLDEKSGAEKKSGHSMIVQASDIHEALATLGEGMKRSMVDYTIASVTETMIMDIFPYSADDSLPVSEPEG